MPFARIFNVTNMSFKILAKILELTVLRLTKGSHRLEKYLNLEGFLEKSLKIKSALKST